MKNMYTQFVCLSVGLYASNVIICDSNIICDVIKYNKNNIFESYFMVDKLLNIGMNLFIGSASIVIPKQLNH